jgi:hypothetical protein
MPPPERESAPTWQGRGGKEKSLSPAADRYNRPAASATSPSPFCSNRVAVVVRVGDRVLAVGSYPDREAALAAPRAVVA